MWYLLLFALILGLLGLPFILHVEYGIPLIITVPLWYIAVPAIVIRWLTNMGKKEREAFGERLLDNEENSVSNVGKDLYRQFVKNCTKCCAFADGSVHVVVRACGECGEWLGRNKHPEHFAFELGYSGPVIMNVFEGSNGCYEQYADERHTDAKPDDVAIRIIWPKYLLTDQKVNNEEHMLRYFAFLTNCYVKNSATEKESSFMRGYKVDMPDKESRRLFQFFIRSE